MIKNENEVNGEQALAKSQDKRNEKQEINHTQDKILNKKINKINESSQLNEKKDIHVIKTSLEVLEEEMTQIAELIGFNVNPERLKILSNKPKQRELLDNFPEWDEVKMRARNSIESILAMSRETPFVLQLSEIDHKSNAKEFFPNFIFLNYATRALQTIRKGLEQIKQFSLKDSFSELIKEHVEYFRRELEQFIPLELNFSMDHLLLDELTCKVQGGSEKSCELQVHFQCPEWGKKVKCERIDALCHRQKIWKVIFKSILKKFEHPYPLIDIGKARPLILQDGKCGIGISYEKVREA